MIVAKVTIVFALALLAAAMLKRATAATRHQVLLAAQVASLLLPLVVLAVPQVEVPVDADDDPALTRLLRSHPLPLAGEGRREASGEGLPLLPIWLTVTTLIATSRLLSILRAWRITKRAEERSGVLMSDELAQPATFLNLVLLPRSSESWDPARRRAVLLHEQAHVDRHDWLAQLAGDAACALWWFHPLAWIAARRAALDRERACDDAAVLRGIAPSSYAAAVVDVARDAASLLPAMAARPHLATRIEAVLDPATARRPLRIAPLLVLLAALIAVPSIAALTPEQIEPDLRGDDVALPQSERIDVAFVPRVEAAGPDAALIAILSAEAARESTSDVDLVPQRSRWALAHARNGEIVAPMLDLLDHRDWRVRAHAAWTLGVARDRRAARPLAALLDDEVWRVRAAAAAALSEIADAGVARAMRDALDDIAWQVRYSAVTYHAAIGGDRRTLEAMRDDRHIAVRTAVEEALRK